MLRSGNILLYTLATGLVEIYTDCEKNVPKGNFGTGVRAIVSTWIVLVVNRHAPLSS